MYTNSFRKMTKDDLEEYSGAGKSSMILRIKDTPPKFSNELFRFFEKKYCAENGEVVDFDKFEGAIIANFVEGEYGLLFLYSLIKGEDIHTYFAAVKDFESKPELLSGMDGLIFNLIHKRTCEATLELIKKEAVYC